MEVRFKSKLDAGLRSNDGRFTQLVVGAVKVERELLQSGFELRLQERAPEDPGIDLQVCAASWDLEAVRINQPKEILAVSEVEFEIALLPDPEFTLAARGAAQVVGLARMGAQLRPALAEGDRTEAARLDEALERYPNHGETFGIKLDVVAARPRAPAHPSGV